MSKHNRRITVADGTYSIKCSMEETNIAILRYYRAQSRIWWARLREAKSVNCPRAIDIAKGRINIFRCHARMVITDMRIDRENAAYMRANTARINREIGPVPVSVLDDIGNALRVAYDDSAYRIKRVLH